jgi:hypothetical protein
MQLREGDGGEWGRWREGEKKAGRGAQLTFGRLLSGKARNLGGSDSLLSLWEPAELEEKTEGKKKSRPGGVSSLVGFCRAA